ETLRSSPTFEVQDVLTGDREAGAKYFNGEGRCATCHSPTGDLKGIGSRLAPAALQQRVMVPRGRGAKPTRVIVTPPGGAAVAGQGRLDPAKLGAPPTDSWPTYHGDYSGRRFSTLSQINTSNVDALTLAWIYRINLGGTSPGSIKATPLQVNGVLYFTVPDH